MKEKCLLTVESPALSTYHFEATTSIVGASNPTFVNWFSNNCTNISCEDKFLEGFTSLRLVIDSTEFYKIPYFDKKRISARNDRARFKEFIEDSVLSGYYVAFFAVDDYYIENKTWYKKRHYLHDGLIVGFDNDRLTYSIAAYDSNWVFRVFETSQKAFFDGVDSDLDSEQFTLLTALKCKDEKIDLNIDKIAKDLKQYINSEKTESSTNPINGFETFEYTEKYIDFLMQDRIEFQKTDYRIMRVIWEHKKCMFKRIHDIETYLQIEHDISNKYKEYVNRANTLRMIYSNYCITGRKSLLSTVKNGFKEITNFEKSQIMRVAELLEKKG